MVPLIPDSTAQSFIRACLDWRGNHDPIIPTSESQRLAELLRGAGADVTIRFAKAGHGLTMTTL